MEGLAYDNFDLWPELDGLDRYSCVVYENQYALPLGFTSDKWISREDYDALDIPRRQQALMQGILLEREPADNFTKISPDPGAAAGTGTGNAGAGAAQAQNQAAGNTITFTDQRQPVRFLFDENQATASGLKTAEAELTGVPAQADAAAAAGPAQTAAGAAQAQSAVQGTEAAAAGADRTDAAGTATGAADAPQGTVMTASGNGERISFDIHQTDAVVSILFDGMTNCETGLYLRGMQYQPPAGARGSTKFLLSVRGYSGGELVMDKQLGYTTPLDPWTTGQTDFLVNAFYHEEKVDRIDITFPEAGTYSFDSIEAVFQPMDDFAAQAQAFRETTLQNLDIHEMGESYATDRITGHIDLDAPRILCLQIPCTPGWTAYVDGARAELLEADTMFSALLLPAGSHDIELRYQTPGLRLGAVISAGTFLILLLFGLIYTIVSLILRIGEKRTEAIPEGSYQPVQGSGSAGPSEGMPAQGSAPAGPSEGMPARGSAPAGPSEGMPAQGSAPAGSSEGMPAQGSEKN